MTRHLPHRRSTKLTVLAAGGALCVATAASATAASWPSASAAPSHAAVQAAAAGLAGAGQRGTPAHDATTTSLAAGDASAFQAMQFGYGARAVDIAVAQARAAYVRAHAQEAARAHAAHEKHLAVLAAARAAAAAAAAARAAAQEAASQLQAAQEQPAQQAAQQQAPGMRSGAPQQIAEAMLAQYGWSGQFSCLDSLWAQESDWNPSAENPGTGAYGIPQAVPGSKMASAGADWQTDPATQIRWGLEYIQSTYGSPCAAWSHEEADGWY